MFSIISNYLHNFCRMTSSIRSGINGLQYFFKNFSQDIPLSVETMREIVAPAKKKVEDLKLFYGQLHADHH